MTATTKRRATGGLTLTVAFTLALTGCSGGFPADPDGTLEQVRGGELRVGVSPAPPWTVLPPPDTPDAEPSGSEVDLVTAFADHLGADVTWVVGGEEDLIGQLERSELDLVVGGLTAQSPWQGKAALTYPYGTTTGPEGKPEKRVMAAPLGENAFLVELESFLLARKDDR
jgi:polar amino acid transport system substrate-binding protein